MTAINQFIELFKEVWREGIFGINVSEIIIGLIIFLFFYVLRRLFARFLIRRLNKIVLKSNAFKPYMPEEMRPGKDLNDEETRN